MSGKSTTFDGDGPEGESNFWSIAGNWTNGLPVNGDTVTVDASGDDQLAGLTSLASVTLAYVGVNLYEPLSIGTLVVEDAGAAFSADWVGPGSGNLTVGTISGSGGDFGALEAGAVFTDDSATAPTNTLYKAIDGGTVELAAAPASSSELFYDGVGTFALENPGANNAVDIYDLDQDDVLELPGNSVSSVSFGANSLSVTTSAGTYAFTNVYYSGNVTNYTAAYDSSTGLEAITLQTSLPNTFADEVASGSGPLSGQFLWSNTENWSVEVPAAGSSATIAETGFDDLSSLSLNVLDIDQDAEVELVGSSLTVTSVVAHLDSALYAGTPIAGATSGAITVTIGLLVGSNGEYGAIGSESTFIDQSTIDPGDSYFADDGGTVELSAAPSGNSVLEYLGSTPSTIALADPNATNATALDDVAHGDVLEVPGNSVSDVTYGSDSLTVVTDAGTYAFTDVTYFFTPTGYVASHDSTTGLEAVRIACYLAGTRIRTVSGDVPVEALRIGDCLATRDGQRPIKWIGRRSYAGHVAASSPAVQPVRISAGALGRCLPLRDLYVSPQHALHFEDGTSTGVLVPAAALVNGSNIVRCPDVGAIHYFHVELDAHAVIFAEGAPAESFVDDNSRLMFDNASEYYDMFGVDEGPHGFSAPRIEEGFQLEAVRRRLAARAGLSVVAAAPGRLQGHVERLEDGVLQGWVVDETNKTIPVELDVLVDGESVARVLANRYRVDLDHAGLAGGRCAFSVTLPAAVTGLSQIAVRRAADGAKLPMPKLAALS